MYLYILWLDPMTTDKQKSAVHFCEEWLHICFCGDLSNKEEVNQFLSEYYYEAQLVCEEYRFECELALEESLY